MAGHDALKLDFVTLDVFTDTRFLGNPLAVVFVPAAVRDRVSQETKQRIAREFNLSETVFLHTLEDEPNRSSTTREIDIFTTEEELPFAGHPTIGSAYLVLHHLGWSHVKTLQTKAGPIRIAPYQGKGGVRAAIPHAVHTHGQSLRRILESQDSAPAAVNAIRKGLSTDPDIREAELDAPAVSIVRGMTFLLVRLPSLEHLGRAAPVNRMDFAKIPDLLDDGEWKESFVARYYYVPLGEPFRGEDNEEVAVRTRMTELGAEDPAGGSAACTLASYLALREMDDRAAAGAEEEEWSDDSDDSQKMAIRTRMVELDFEDPATGSAACTLASYLAAFKKGEMVARFAITQGVEMGRRSEIAVDAFVQWGEEAKIRAMHLGGTAVVVMSGSISA